MTAEEIMSTAIPAVWSRGDGCTRYYLPAGSELTPGVIFRVEHAGVYCYYRLDAMPADGQVATGYACSWPSTPEGVVYLGRSKAGFGAWSFSPAPPSTTRLEKFGAAV